MSIYVCICKSAYSEIISPSTFACWPNYFCENPQTNWFATWLSPPSSENSVSIRAAASTTQHIILSILSHFCCFSVSSHRQLFIRCQSAGNKGVMQQRKSRRKKMRKGRAFVANTQPSWSMLLSYSHRSTCGQSNIHTHTHTHISSRHQRSIRPCWRAE